MRLDSIPIWKLTIFALVPPCLMGVLARSGDRYYSIGVVVSLIIVWLVIRLDNRDGKQSSRTLYSLSARSAALFTLSGVGLYFSSFLLELPSRLIWLWLDQQGAVHTWSMQSRTFVESFVFSERLLATSIAFIMVFPLLEELYFRRILLSRLEMKYNHTVATVLVNSIFCVFHPPRYVSTFIHGVVYSHAFRKNRNVSAIIFMHIGLNAAANTQRYWSVFPWNKHGDLFSFMTWSQDSAYGFCGIALFTISYALGSGWTGQRIGYRIRQAFNG